MDLSPDLVEYVKMGFHLLREKVELAIAFPRWTNEVILFQGPDVMLRDPIMNVKRLSELVDIARFVAKEIDDLATIGSATGPRENIP